MLRVTRPHVLAHVGVTALPEAFQVLRDLDRPARRPIQITQDLEGFWKGSYADVRKDMRARYPKHQWPENPLDAEPTQRTVKRKP